MSDLGIASYSGNDGINVFVNSLATTEVKAGIEVRLMSRSNEILSTKRTDANGRAQFEAGLSRGEGGMSPAMVVATDPKGDYAFLSLKGPGFDLTDRGVRGRMVPAGLDAFVYTERGVYRAGETVQITALLRDSQGVAATSAPLILVIERPDGLEYRRVTTQDQGVGGRSLSLALNPGVSTGTWRVRAYTDPKRPTVGDTSFLVEDYVPDRMEFELATKAAALSRTKPVEITVDGRYLYGAPASGLDLEGELEIRTVRERPNFAGYQFGLDDDITPSDRKPLEDMPQTDEQGKAKFEVNLEKLPATTRPLSAQITVRMAEAGGRAVERKLSLPVAPAANMVGVKPLFAGRSLGEGENATFDIVFVVARWRAAGAEGPALRASQGRAALSVLPARRLLELRGDQVQPPHRGRTDRRRRRQAGPHHGAGAMGPLPARSLDRRAGRPGDLDPVHRGLLHRGDGRHAGHARARARQAGVQAGRKPDGAHHRAHGGSR